MSNILSFTRVASNYFQVSVMQLMNDDIHNMRGHFYCICLRSVCRMTREVAHLQSLVPIASPSSDTGPEIQPEAQFLDEG